MKDSLPQFGQENLTSKLSDMAIPFFDCGNSSLSPSLAVESEGNHAPGVTKHPGNHSKVAQAAFFISNVNRGERYQMPIKRCVFILLSGYTEQYRS